MSETVTFRKEMDGLAWEFTVKSEFMTKVDVENTDVLQLLSSHNLVDYLHSTTGPAQKNLSENYFVWWVNGKQSSPEEVEKLKANAAFNDKLEKTLDEHVGNDKL